LAAVFSHPADPEESQRHYTPFISVFEQWIRLNNTGVESVNESAALKGNFPETEGSTQTASILLYMSDN
jgi:hypothetical protein